MSKYNIIKRKNFLESPDLLKRGIKLKVRDLNHPSIDRDKEPGLTKKMIELSGQCVTVSNVFKPFDAKEKYIRIFEDKGYYNWILEWFE